MAFAQGAPQRPTPPRAAVYMYRMYLCCCRPTARHPPKRKGHQAHLIGHLSVISASPHAAGAAGPGPMHAAAL